MIDDYKSHAASLTTPAAAAEAITPSNGSDLAYATRAIYVGTGGDLSVELIHGDVVTFRNLPSGSVLPVRAKRVRNTNTTASDLIGLR